LHDILETIREQIRLEVAPEHRPATLFQNIQDAVYAMRGRTRLMDDAAITHILNAAQPTGLPLTPEAIARCIDPRAWNDIHVMRRDIRQREALEKADAILAPAAQPPAAPVETEEEETCWPVEIWHGERKVSIYPSSVLRIWGPNMDTHMTDETRTHETVAAAVDWLYAVPRSSADSAIADQNLLLRSNEIKLDATVRIFRKALQHVSDQRWNEEATVERLCDHADNTLEREVKANDPVTPVKDRRSVWLRMALYNIQIGRCHDPREHARKALEDDDLLASLSSDEPQTVPAMLNKIQHRGVFIERQLQAGGAYRFICHTGISKFLPDLYDTQEQAIKAVDEKLEAKLAAPALTRPQSGSGQ